MLDLEKHDRFLFGDDTFSRSRRYFWVMNSLAVFQEQIDDTIRQWDFFWGARGTEIDRSAKVFDAINGAKGYPLFGGDEAFQEVKSDIADQQRRLKSLKSRYEGFYSNTLSLHDGVSSNFCSITRPTLSLLSWSKPFPMQ